MNKETNNNIINFKKALNNILPQLKALSEAYEIPFVKSLKIMEEDRETALANYNRFVEMIENEDDSASAKEGLNKAMEHIIKSTDKLNKMMETASKMIADSMKAIAIAKSKEMINPKDKNYITSIRKNVIDVDSENEDDDTENE